MIVDGLPELMDICETGINPLRTMLEKDLNDHEIDQV